MPSRAAGRRGKRHLGRTRYDLREEMGMVDWPAASEKDLVLGNPESNLGICTLWTEKRRICEALSPDDYLACGNLYSFSGISVLLRSILANPRIRYLLVCGTDATGTGHALVSLWERGVDERGHIRSTGVPLDPGLPVEVVDEVRRSVRLIDMRGCNDPARVKAAIQGLPPLPPFASPRLFPDREKRVLVLPSEKTGYRVERRTISRAWLDVLRLLFLFGQTTASENGVERKELLNLLAVVSAEDPVSPHIPSWLPVSAGTVDEHLSRFLMPPEMPGAHADGLRGFRGVDQLRAMVEKLEGRASTHRVIATLWDQGTDREGQSPLCLAQLLATVQSGRLYLTATFISHDVFADWLADAYALWRLQGEMGRVLGIDLGALTIISHLVYIHQDVWQRAEEVLAAHYPRTLAWRSDPRGLFRISVQDGQIVVEHEDPLLGATGRRFSGRSAQQVYKAIINESLVSLPEHGAYLGSELTKAETALKLGLEYRQDANLDVRGPNPATGL